MREAKNRLARLFAAVTGLLDAHDNRCFAPQSFQIVISAFFRQEAVHDNVTVIEQHPAVICKPFAAPGTNLVFLFRLVADVLSDCFELANGTGAEDDEEIRDR